MVVISFEELDELIGDLKEDISNSRGDDWPPVLCIRPVSIENYRDKHGGTEYVVGLVVRFHHRRRGQIWAFFHPVGTYSRLYGKYSDDGEERHRQAIREVERLEISVLDYVQEQLSYFQVSRALVDIGSVKLERGRWKKWEDKEEE